MTIAGCLGWTVDRGGADDLGGAASTSFSCFTTSMAGGLSASLSLVSSLKSFEDAYRPFWMTVVADVVEDNECFEMLRSVVTSLHIYQLQFQQLTETSQHTYLV